MAKLTILRGISGSGKDTWAMNQNAVVVSRDNIRHGLMGISPEDWYSAEKDVMREREDMVTALEDASIAALLKAGKDVIVADTNTQFKFVRRLAKIGYRHGAEVEVKVFDVDVETALHRNTLRAAQGGRFVNVEILKRQHEQFKNNKNMTLDRVENPQPYNGTPGKPKAFLVDIDGTLAHMNGKRGPFEWHNVGMDDPDEVILDIASRLGGRGDLNHDDLMVIVMSGRDEACREQTEEWLEMCDFVYDDLFMRPQGDQRPDNLIKAELFDEYVRDNFDVQFVLDDRQQVVDMWRRMGLTCLQVAESFD